MDREFVKDLSRKENEKLDRKEFVRELSSLNKMSFFKKGKTHRDECNDQAIQPNIQAPYLALKTQLKQDVKHKDPKTQTDIDTKQV